MAGLFLARGQGPDFAPAHMPGARAHEVGGWRLFHESYACGGPETLL